MEKKLRILQLSPRIPFPEDDGGKIGIANIFKQFSLQGCQPSLFFYSESEPDKGLIESSEKYGQIIYKIHSTLNTSVRIARSLFDDQPVYLRKHLDERIKRYFDELIGRQEFDVIHADHTCMAPLGFYIRSITGKPLGLRLHNIEWMIWHRYASVLPKWHPKRTYISRQARLLKAEEARLIAQADVSFAITENDRAMAMEMAPGANVIIASAGINPEDWVMDNPVIKNPYEMVLATTYHWIHNINAVEWFIGNVMPLIRNEVSQASLTLIGKEAPEHIRHTKAGGVNFIGYVPSVQPYYHRAGIYIAPLFVGSGIRIKILEAMASGLPVVATGLSAEGINAGEENGLFRADDPVKFAEHIIKLLNDPRQAAACGAAARIFVTEHFSWKNNVAKMINEYKKLCPSFL